jgi:outer membrane protein, heavy metal efflux system
MKGYAGLAAAALLWGCAAYRPLPLAGGDAALAPPVAAILARDAAAIDRPFLPPAPIDLAAPLDAKAIAVIAVIANPDLKAQRARAGVADAQAFAARLLPDPSFSLGADKVISGPDPFANLVGALALNLNALRTRHVDVAKTRAEARQVRLDLAWAEWQTAGQARIQAARILALTHSFALARESRDAAQSLLDRTLRAAGRGDLAADQVQAQRTAAFDAAERYRAAEQDLAAARLELTRLLGLPPETTIRLAPEPEPAAPPDAARLFAIARKERADLRALEAGYAAEEAAVHKAVLDQFPALNLTLNASRDTSNNLTLGPAVDFTLPLWNRNRGGIAVERATRAALKAEYDARLFQTRAEIATAVSGISVARAQRAALLRDIPPLARIAEASRRAADRGDLAPAAAETTEQALRDKQILLNQSERDIAEQMIALELLTGTPGEMWARDMGTG